jgi:hypothetical protein
VRVLLATIAVAGCSFEHWEPQAGGGSGVDDPMGVDANLSTTVTCKYPDGALRLCIEFEDGNYSTATDGAPFHLNLDTANVSAWTRGTQKAALTAFTTKLDVPEHPMLDIAPAITFETFLAVSGITGYHSAKLLYNEDQYELALESDGKVTCRVGGITVRTDVAIGKDTWRHIACVYDGSSLSVWLGGSPAKCQSGSGAIPTAGSHGTRLTYGLTAVVDDLRVYARALTPAEICSHADKSSCASTCPGG